MLQNEVTMPLSFTAIKAFEQCPQRFYQERVLKKFPYEQSEEAKRGDMIHKAFEVLRSLTMQNHLEIGLKFSLNKMVINMPSLKWQWIGKRRK